jgi:hypothetical protein
MGWPGGPARDRLNGDMIAVVEGRFKLEMASKSVRIITPAAN